MTHGKPLAGSLTGIGCADRSCCLLLPFLDIHTAWHNPESRLLPCLVGYIFWNIPLCPPKQAVSLPDTKERCLPRLCGKDQELASCLLILPQANEHCARAHSNILRSQKCLAWVGWQHWPQGSQCQSMPGVC